MLFLAHHVAAGIPAVGDILVSNGPCMKSLFLLVTMLIWRTMLLLASLLLATFLLLLTPCMKDLI